MFSQQSKYEYQPAKKSAIKIDKFKSISCGVIILTMTNRDMFNTVSRSHSEEERLHPALASLALSLFAPESKLEMEQFVWLEGP